MSYAFSRNASRSVRAAAIAVLASCAAFVVPRTFAAGPVLAPAVEITKFTFAPKEITVTPGTKIVWTNRDGTPHTVTSNDKSFASKGLDTDDKYDHTFATEGNFTYYCTLHPMMTGIVHVRRP